MRVAGILSVAIAFMIADAATEAAADAAPVRARATLQDSSELFQRFCVSCHGKSGKGNGPAAAYLDPRPANLTDAAVVGQLSDEELLDVITNGRRTMPAFGALLKPDEVRAVAAYVRSLQAGQPHGSGTDRSPNP
jgi:mono/diheme cytochrome c family protein